MTDKGAVETFIEENEPVEQDRVEERFGTSGLSALRELMRTNRVSYTVDWKLITEDD